MAVILLVLVHSTTHANIETMIKRVQEHFYVDNLHALATLTRQICSACCLARTDSPRLYFAGRHARASHFHDIVSIDHVVLPTVSFKRKTYTYILTVYDLFTKHSAHFPLATLSAPETTEAFRLYIRMFSAPRHVISDMGRTFLSREFQSMLEEHNIKYSSNSAYVPESHPVERENLILSKFINIFSLAYDTDNWVMLLPRISDAIRMLERKYTIADQEGKLQTIKSSSHKFLYGVDPPQSAQSLIADLFGHQLIPPQVLQWRQEIHEELRQGHAEEERLFQQLEKRREESRKKLHVGDFVLVQKMPREKRGPQYERQVYRVISIKGYRIHLVTAFNHPRGQPKLKTTHLKLVKPCTLNMEEFKHVPKELLERLKPFLEGRQGTVPQQQQQQQRHKGDIRSLIFKRTRKRKEEERETHTGVPDFLLWSDDDSKSSVGTISSNRDDQPSPARSTSSTLVGTSFSDDASQRSDPIREDLEEFPATDEELQDTFADDDDEAPRPLFDAIADRIGGLLNSARRRSRQGSTSSSDGVETLVPSQRSSTSSNQQQDSVAQTLRRSTRSRRAPDRYGYS